MYADGLRRTEPCSLYGHARKATMVTMPGFLYPMAKDVWSWMRGRRKQLSPAKILEYRQKWKPRFEEEIAKNHAQQLRPDVIIRDIKRIDVYPKINESQKGISPWFRAALLDIYHRGVLIGLSWHSLTLTDGGQWRYADHQNKEERDLRAVLVGRIPFENIETVDWEGDEYYAYPHIYCYFDAKRKEPYEALAFYEKKDFDGRPYYSEVATLEDVNTLSNKLGIETMF
jgi:hypothetical protein